MGSSGVMSAGDAPTADGGMIDDGVLTIALDAESIGLVIGRAGTTVKQLQAETGANVSVARERSCAVMSASTPAAVEAARDWITNLLEKHAAASALEVTVSVDCGRQLGAVMGRGGVIVRRSVWELLGCIHGFGRCARRSAVFYLQKAPQGAPMVTSLVRGRTVQPT